MHQLGQVVSLRYCMSRVELVSLRYCIFRAFPPYSLATQFDSSALPGPPSRWAGLLIDRRPRVVKCISPVLQRPHLGPECRIIACRKFLPATSLPPTYPTTQSTAWDHPRALHVICLQIRLSAVTHIPVTSHTTLGQCLRNFATLGL